MKLLWSQIIKKYIPWIVVLVFLMLCSSGTSVFNAYLYMKLIDGISNFDIPNIYYIALLYLIVLLVGFLFEICITYLNKKMTNEINISLVDMTFKKLLSSTGEDIAQSDSSEYTSLLLVDTAKVSDVIPGIVMPMVLAIFRVVGMVCFLAYVNLKLLIFILLLQPILFWVQRITKKKLRITSEQQRNNNIGLIECIKEYSHNLLEIIAFGNNSYFLNSLSKTARKAKQSELNNMMTSSTNEGILGLFAVFPTVLILMLGGYEVSKHQISVGALLLYVQYYTSLFSPVSVIYNKLCAMENVNPSIDSICKLISKRIDNNLIEFNYKNMGNQITISNVTFGYEKNMPILSDINMKFIRGKTYGISGESGSGKSTLCKLLLGFWEVNDGTICFGEANINSLNKESLRNNICYISQETFMFNDTIENNILLGKEADINLMDTVLSKVNLQQFVKMMPDGIKTNIGENGVLLSGGQRKRLELSRSLVKDSVLVILDEPTNGLDENNAKNIMRKLIESFRNTILVIISHDKNIMDMCDEVYYIEKGFIRRDA